MSQTKTLAVAALAGLLGSAIFTAGIAVPSFAHADDQATSSDSAMPATPKFEKHACKGQNSCKGLGRDGKNACKGKGSCATDGSKP